MSGQAGHGPVQLSPESIKLEGFPCEIELRPAQTGDAQALAELLIQSRRALMPYLPQVHSDAEVHTWMAEHLIPAGVVTLAALDDKVVGMMALSSEAGHGWIDHLYVRPDSVSRGLGSALLSRAIQRLGAPIRLYTFQANHGAQRFYARHGFEAIALSDGQNNEEHLPDVLLELSLSIS